MRITEIFSSIQGESTFQGLPCVFVRLTGCNLDCSYCDTRYARSGGTVMTLTEVIQRVEDYGLSFVCLTGGEPLLQEDTPRLAQEFIIRGYTVSVETNGTIDASALPDNVIRVIDIKCPGSGEDGKTFPGNTNEIRPADEFKFVLTDRNDFEYACRYVEKYKLSDNNTALFSPALGILEPEKLAGWIMEELPKVRLHLQLHKYIWPKRSDEGGY